MCTEDVLTPAQMAADIGITRAGVERRIASGEIVCPITRGEAERFREKYVQDMTAVLADDF
ncbi:hypothetical protein [Mycolicibacter minnesotensis]|jgi:predicted site-specific integrase-resolvase